MTETAHDRLDGVVTALWVIVLTAVIGDYITTIWGLETLAMRESNPFVRSLLSSYGYPAFGIIKIVFLGVLYGATIVLPRKLGVSSLFGVALPHVYAVGSNSLLIIGSGA